MIRAASKRSIPLVLVNARLSARSYKRWRLLPGFARSLLGAFKLCLAQSSADADRFAALGAANAQSVGNLKYASPPLPADDAALETLRGEIGARPVWLAASTHPGEEAIVAEAHSKLCARHPALLTIIVPRHPERGEAIVAELSSGDPKVARRGAGEPITAETGIYLADTLGELGIFYRLAPIAFVGGSLVPHGGQNLLEPAQLDCAILHGPNIFNFDAIAEAMKSARATERVFDAGSLAAAVDTLLTDKDLRDRRAAAAVEVAAGEAGVLDRIMAALEPHLNSPPADAAPKQPDPKRSDQEERHARA
jgi:3-deoxy-D-manno-octulosonic-acid transferase